MDAITVRAYAKINTVLEITEKRQDGYHNIRSVMVSLRLHDTLSIKAMGNMPRTEKQKLILTCEDRNLPKDKRNLVYKAAIFLINEYNINQNVIIDIRKRIPVSAGLGGGSSDCAKTLIGMNELFGLNILKQNLMQIGKQFGADVPYCIKGGVQLAEGIGDKLTGLPNHPKTYVVLARYPVKVSTADIFKLYDNTYAKPDDKKDTDNTEAMVEALEQGNIDRIAGLFYNDLLPITSKLHPGINAIIDKMRQSGALNASMTGSGPTVFGFFSEKETAKKCIQNIRREFPMIKELFFTGLK